MKAGDFDKMRAEMAMMAMSVHLMQTEHSAAVCAKDAVQDADALLAALGIVRDRTTGETLAGLADGSIVATVGGKPTPAKWTPPWRMPMRWDDWLSSVLDDSDGKHYTNDVCTALNAAWEALGRPQPATQEPQP